MSAEKVELTNLLLLCDKLLPKAPEPERLTLEEQQALATVARNLAKFVREIHYWHEHTCRERHGDSPYCLVAAYKYLTEVGG